jgi:hypothetical protein
MAADNSAEMTEDVFVYLVRIFAAFAQGTGTLPIDRAVIARARNDYSTVVSENVQRWDRVELRVLEAARLMGRLAAHRALGRDGRVLLDDYTTARQTVINSGLCPFSHAPDYQ